ncbi:MAG: glycosyltransferase family 39 protein [Acidimicrobiales bacterium]
MTAVLDAAPAGVEPSPRSHRRVAWTLPLVPVVLALGLAVMGHVWGSPRTDDWAFARVAYSLHHTAHIHLVGWSQMNLVGLVVWAQPWLWALGDHMWVLDLSAIALVAIGLGAAFTLARRLLGPSGGLMALATLVMFPGFLRDIPTFMTDAPALAVQAIALALGLAALSSVGRRRLVLMWAVAAVGLFGFTIREFAIAAPLAVLGALIVQRQRHAVRAAAALLGACAAFFAWRQGLAGTQALSGHVGASTALVTVVQAACTLSLGLVPVLAWTARAWWRPVLPRVRVRGHLLGAALALIPLAVAHSTGATPQWLVGHYLDPAGVNGDVGTLGVRPHLLPGPVWMLLSVAAIVAMVTLCGLVAEAVATRHRRTSSPVTTMLTLHVALVAAACVAAAVLNGQLFDRYLWPLVLSSSILILYVYRHRAPVPRRLVACCLFVGAVLSVALTVNSNAFDAARWQAGQALVARGIPAQRIDAGFEWTGAHATAVADLTKPYGGGGAASWWTAWFPHDPICAVVAASPVRLPGFTLATTRRWNLLGVAIPERLYVYRSTDPGCVTAPPRG